MRRGGGGKTAPPSSSWFSPASVSPPFPTDCDLDRCEFCIPKMSTSKLQGMLGKMSFSKRKSGGGGGKVKTPSDNPRWEVSAWRFGISHCLLLRNSILFFLAAEATEGTHDHGEGSP